MFYRATLGCRAGFAGGEDAWGRRGGWVAGRVVLWYYGFSRVGVGRSVRCSSLSSRERRDERKVTLPGWIFLSSSFFSLTWMVSARVASGTDVTAEPKAILVADTDFG